jgi:hypothetical protein
LKQARRLLASPPLYASFLLCFALKPTKCSTKLGNRLFKYLDYSVYKIYEKMINKLHLELQEKTSECEEYKSKYEHLQTKFNNIKSLFS